MKQITIYDLLPLLKKGWVAMDNNGRWWWYSKKPVPTMESDDGLWIVITGYSCELPSCFNIAPYQGDWKDSLRRIHSPKRTKKETWIRGKVPKGIDLYKAFGIKKEG